MQNIELLTFDAARRTAFFAARPEFRDAADLLKSVLKTVLKTETSFLVQKRAAKLNIWSF